MPRKSGFKSFEPFIHINLNCIFGWLVLVQAHFGCHDILMFGKSPIKWRRRPDMTIAVDWDAKPEIKTNKKQCEYASSLLRYNWV